jgi:hypothetical protein
MKILYYMPNMVSPEHREYHLDAEYDILEREYLELADTLRRPPTVHDMVGVDITRPSVLCALTKLNKGK